MIMGLDWTYHAHQFIFCFLLHVSFLLHVKYTLSYRIVSYRSVVCVVYSKSGQSNTMPNKRQRTISTVVSIEHFRHAVVCNVADTESG